MILQDAICLFSFILDSNDIPYDFQKAGKELQNLSDTLARVNAELEAYTKEIKQADDDLVKAKSEREEIILLVSKIETNAAAQDVPLIPEELDFSIIKCQKILTELHKNRHQFDEQLNKAEAQLKDTKGIIQSLEAVLANHTGSHKVCQDKLDDLERHFLELGMFNESKLPVNQILDLVEAARTKLADLNKWKNEQEIFRAKAQNEWNDCRTERIKIESNLKEWEQTLGRLSAEIDDFRFKCKTLNLPLDASPDVIQKAKDRLVHEKNSLHLAKQIVERYEWFLKATALEIERKNLDRVIMEVKQTVNNTNEEIAKLHEATKETERWISKLSKSVNVAIKAKIDAHEPAIIRLFKNMIPCPYLFEKITMKSDEDRLKLGLRYRGQKKDAGEPRFFLSSAQANVLALSIFLSFATEQNWSKLETILLDDPVQHLDDLDAVAFLDNLRAIALGKFGRRKQIVVSTCDKNLYLLMVRKFDLLATDDLKFTGISLLDKGFGGPEIIYDIGGPQNRQLHLRAV